MAKFKPKTLVYLASPFTYKTKVPFLRGIMERRREKQISKAAGILEERYPHHAFILPITMSYRTQQLHRTLGGEFYSWADTDYTYITACQELWVVMMDGWDRSVGVLAEIQFAKKRKMLIKYFDAGSLLEVKV